LANDDFIVYTYIFHSLVSPPIRNFDASWMCICSKMFLHLFWTTQVTLMATKDIIIHNLQYLNIVCNCKCLPFT